MIAVVPLHFLYVEHFKLQKKFGEIKGAKIAEAYGLISRWNCCINRCKRQALSLKQRALEVPLC